MLSNRKLCYTTVFTMAIAWYMLWAYLIGMRYSGEWAAYILAIYLSGFLEVGIEKFFNTMTYKDDPPIKKGYICLFAVAFPTLIAEILCEIRSLTGTYNRYIAAFCIVTVGTALYRLIYWSMEILIDKIHNRR